MYNSYEPLFSVASFGVSFKHIGTTEQHVFILFCSFMDINPNIEKVINTELTAA